MGEPALSLYDQIDELQERVRQLEDMLAGDDGSVRVDTLTGAEQRLLNCLMKRDRPSIDMLYHACVPQRNHGETDQTVVRVRVSKMRKKLKPIHIHNSSGRGYFITPEDKERLRRGHSQ